jgi:hypothetical protein
MFFSNDENQSQENPRHLHPTFSYKPKPALQLISQNARLDPTGRASITHQKPGNPEDVPLVPSASDLVYDPSDPEADWSGLVQKNPHKKHIHNHIAMREGIERNEYGIISKEERKEWAQKRAPTDPSVSKSAGTLVLGGIDNPEDRYKTSYNRFVNQERTSKDQLTLEKRQNPVKKIEDPSQSKSLAYQQQQQQLFLDSNNAYHGTTSSNPSASFSSRGMFSGKSSLLSGIGEKLISDSSIPEYHQERQSRPNEHYRNLITENYKPYPGKFFLFSYCFVLSLFFFLGFTGVKKTY